MLFENNNYLDMFLGMPNMNNQINQSVSDDNVGFLRGNMFDNEYKPYKNYTYIKPKVKNAKEELMFKIMEYSFAINDYNLYLDVHPENMEILNKYKMCVEKLKAKEKEYEEKYGPLSIDYANYNSFKWIESPWPWEREDGSYV